MNENALLGRYAREGDEEAFRELVQHHLNFVYAAALRQVGGDTQLAQDVAQIVFTDLARKAQRLADHPVLKGWLFTSTRFAAAKLVRRERLRQRREESAHAMQPSETSAPIRWDEIRAELDAVLAELKEKDRTAVLLRFFESEGYAEIGARLRITEDASRMRVERALDQLRHTLARRGITSTPLALATTLSAQAAIAAPAGLAQSVAGTALTQATVAGPVAGALQIFMGTKTTFGTATLAVLAGILSTATIGVAVYETRLARRAETATVAAQADQKTQIARLKALQQQASSSDARTAEIKQVLDQAEAALAQSQRISAQRGAVSHDRHADGVRFLASFPRARALLIESGKARTSPKLLEIFRQAGLSEAQIDSLNTRIWANRADSLTLAPDAMGWSVSGFPPDEEMRQTLGEAGFGEFQRFTRMAEVYDAATQVAAAVGYTAAPLNPAQIDQLAQAMWTIKPSATLAPGTPEWETATAPMRTTMTPDQWQLAEGALASVLFPRILAFTQRHATSGAVNAQPKSGS